MPRFQNQPPSLIRTANKLVNNKSVKSFVKNLLLPTAKAFAVTPTQKKKEEWEPMSEVKKHNKMLEDYMKNNKY